MKTNKKTQKRRAITVQMSGRPAQWRESPPKTSPPGCVTAPPDRMPRMEAAGGDLLRQQTGQRHPQGDQRRGPQVRIHPEDDPGTERQ